MTDLPELPSELVEQVTRAILESQGFPHVDSVMSSRPGGPTRDLARTMLRAALTARGPSGRLLYLASELEPVAFVARRDFFGEGDMLVFVGPDKGGFPVFRLPQDQEIA